MNPIAFATAAIERLPVPDALNRAGIRFLVERTRRRLASVSDRDSEFAGAMTKFPVAEHADTANEQHYEVPAGFFELVLGPHRKYSCCLYQSERDTLAAAEENALSATCAHADLHDGQRILELGCGWGSLSLYMAAHYPGARIVSVSNSHSQRQFIESEARYRGLTNLRVVTADMNAFATDERFDRIASVEMFEHMANWQALLARTRTWLSPEGRLFIHVFTHRSQPYRFDHRDKNDWIAQHFFTGGIMPSRSLIRHFSDLFTLEQQWDWNGEHYARTARDWLRNFDANTDEIREILCGVYGGGANLWFRRWRLFFLATEGLFGHAGGHEWGVSHYRLKPTQS